MSVFQTFSKSQLTRLAVEILKLIFFAMHHKTTYFRKLQIITAVAPKLITDLVINIFLDLTWEQNFRNLVYYYLSVNGTGYLARVNAIAEQQYKKALFFYILERRASISKIYITGWICLEHSLYYPFRLSNGQLKTRQKKILRAQSGRLHQQLI